ncbi:serpin E3 [Protopterus annectens]|uniref:serpin E3 n=1 Tax=Protopterus annectens TaxID=7888 RepID=UPI001CFB8858|nr:serpin E3 [Protopterus annectens]
MWWFAINQLFLCLWFLSKGSCHPHNVIKDLNTGFAVRIYQAVARMNNKTNLIVSPTSISTSLGLLQLGAQGNTFAQLENALGYNAHDRCAQDFLRYVYKELDNSSQHALIKLANTLFIQTGTHLLPHFKDAAALWTNSSLQLANFSDHIQTASVISNWLTTNNAGKLNNQMYHILDLFSGGKVGSAVPQLAVITTVYFKTSWQSQFSVTDTQSLLFTDSEGSILKVPMMHQRADVNYGQFKIISGQKITVLELPYIENTASMFVVLPVDRKTALRLIEPYITAKSIADWTKNMKRTTMDIFIPRFRLQNLLNLKNVLSSIGITDLFDPCKANLKGISDQENLYVSEAIHEVRITANENGSKASASTVMMLLKRSRTPVFKADRPFFFFLRQTTTDSILFMGRVTNPLE